MAGELGAGTLDFFNTPQGGNVLALALGMGSKMFNQKGNNADVLSNLVMQYAGAQQSAQQLRSALGGLGTLASSRALGQAGAAAGTTTAPQINPLTSGEVDQAPVSANVLPTAAGNMATPASSMLPTAGAQPGLGSQEYTLGVLSGLLGGQANSPFNYRPRF